MPSCSTLAFTVDSMPTHTAGAWDVAPVGHINFCARRKLNPHQSASEEVTGITLLCNRTEVQRRPSKNLVNDFLPFGVEQRNPVLLPVSQRIGPVGSFICAGILRVVPGDGRVRFNGLSRGRRQRVGRVRRLCLGIVHHGGDYAIPNLIISKHPQLVSRNSAFPTAWFDNGPRSRLVEIVSEGGCR